MKRLFQKLTNRNSKAAKSGRTARQKLRRSLQMENLENRKLFVVGAFDVPAPVDPGVGYDGVVKLEIGGATCTGSLLPTGRHILTAAHCVDEGVVNTDVRFEMPGGDVVIGAGPASIHPLWNGSTVNGYDIAILELDVLAPSGPQGSGAERYEIYDGGNEEGLEFTLVGYGRTGTGETGNSNASGVKRMGLNRWDKDANALANRPMGLRMSMPQGAALAYDFDSGWEKNDAFGEGYSVYDTGFGADEVMQSQGDSGGPAFVDGKISGVVSASRRRLPSTDIDSLGNNTFGEFAFMTNARFFSSWIDQQIYESHELVVDMSHQAPGNDGNADFVTLKRNMEHVEFWVNGDLFHSELASRINSLELKGSEDSETIKIEGDLGFEVHFEGNGGINRLDVVGTSASDRFDVWSTKVEVNFRDYTFEDLSRLRVFGGEGNDDIYYRTVGSFQVFMYGQADDDQLFVLTPSDNSSSVWFFGNGGNDELRASTRINTWEIDDVDDGKLNNIRFYSAENLRGGWSTDRFRFVEQGSISGNLNGRGGNDTLDYSAYEKGIHVNLQQQTASLIGGSLTGIEDVIGTHHDDVVIGNGWANDIYGLGGNDVLSGLGGDDIIDGDEGRDFLLGGDGSDKLFGGQDQDILMGGITDYDQDANSLEALMAVWASKQGLRDRLKAMRNGVAFGKGSVAFNSDTVQDDSDGDDILGEGDKDWFFAMYGDSSDRAIGEFSH